MTRRDISPTGAPCWVETLQPDPGSALAFYGPLLGWTLDGGRSDSRRARGRQSRNGKPLTRCFPELAALPRGRYVIDGEIVIRDERGRENFDALSQRIHPRSPGSTAWRRRPRRA